MTAAVSPTSKRLHLIRHAQAEHNVENDYTIADAPLTALGKQQSRDLHNMTVNNLQKTAELLVSSPMRRPMETMLLGLPDLKARLEKEGRPVILNDLLQEVGGYPCDTPTYPPTALERSNNGIFAEAGLDFSTLSPDYASKQGIYAPEAAQERARRVRRWLRDRPEREIVLVAHGDILRNIADGQNSSRPWANAEVKLFSFASATDPDATLVEVRAPESKPIDATQDPTSGEMAAEGGLKVRQDLSRA